MDDWTRVAKNTYSKAVNSPVRFIPLHLSAIVRQDKLWHLFISNTHIAAFQTFEELDGAVPVLLNGFLNRSGK